MDWESIPDVFDKSPELFVTKMFVGKLKISGEFRTVSAVESAAGPRTRQRESIRLSKLTKATMFEYLLDDQVISCRGC